MGGNKILYSVLSSCLAMLGLTGCQPACEYGPPPVEYDKYRVGGIVTDNKFNPLKGIEIKVVDTYSDKDVKFYTDSEGSFESPTLRTSLLGKQMLQFTDTDGVANGGEFRSKTISIQQMKELNNDDEKLYIIDISLENK